MTCHFTHVQCEYHRCSHSRGFKYRYHLLSSTMHDKMTSQTPPRQPSRVVGRSTRADFESSLTTAVASTPTACDATSRAPTRNDFGSRSLSGAAARRRSRSSRCRARLSQQGNGAIRRPLLGPFGHMVASACQRESSRRQTHAMVYRLDTSMAGRRQAPPWKPVERSDDRSGTPAR